MGTVMKHPGVYIVEKSAFPNSVVEVATAVPAFIGFTETASYKSQDLASKPWRISSMAEFVTCFGGPPSATAKKMATPLTFSVTSTAPATNPVKAFTVNNKPYFVTPAQGASMYLLYSSMSLFFQNGGGICYIVSVGSYGDAIDSTKLKAGVDLLLKEQEPTMIVIPDAVRLATVDEFNDVQGYTIQHCAYMKSRVAILDIYDGYDELNAASTPVDTFRNKIPMNNLDLAAAYYPWLETTVLGDDLVTPSKYMSTDDLKALLTDENSQVPPAGPPIDLKLFDDLKNNTDLLDRTLSTKSAAVGQALTEIKRQLNLLPPSPAIAGVYSMVDNSLGVWKAPANVGLNAVIAPAVSISDQDQDNLNVDVYGKSVNAIRSFIGQGVLVWGARTLDGNSLDWRYVGVRRTMIMLEQSIMLAAKAYVFENNVSTTWVTVKSMIRNFLTGIWKRGGLAGASPDDAFQVFCGLGETMTADDILEGILRVTVLVAITRPAEFIEITFQQQMQKS